MMIRTGSFRDQGIPGKKIGKGGTGQGNRYLAFAP
jgi:hypothetical protein